MSDSNPTPEERNRIVEAVTSKMMSREIIGAKPDELMQLKARRDVAKNHVLAHMKPIIDAAVMMPPKSPLYAHSESGRAQLTIHALKCYLDELRDFDKDEILWLLSLEYADRTIEYHL